MNTLTQSPPGLNEPFGISEELPGNAYVCECCASTHDADDYTAAIAGWRKTHDGWVCPCAAPQLFVADSVRNQALPGTREGEMVVLETDKDGTPTIWCDPEIADLVRALNVGGLRTVASCSGHGETPFGIVSLQDGRELLVLRNWETTREAERLLLSGLSAQPQQVATEAFRVTVEADAWEAAQFHFGGEGEPFNDCTLWVGEIENDAGSKTHGLHISCNECPEEGSTTLAAFDPLDTQPRHDEVASLVEAASPFAALNSSDPTITIRTPDIRRLRSAIAPFTALEATRGKS